MKKLLLAGLTCIAVLSISVPAFAGSAYYGHGHHRETRQQNCSENHCFTDLDGNGVCDYFSDEDGDQICDRCTMTDTKKPSGHRHHCS